jgi:DNA-binding transcriptional ArsR family regulator
MTNPAPAAIALAAVARLLADDTRATFCLALLDGRAWTAGELARLARVAPSTASGHLDRLVAGGLLTEERQGRHRYLRLAGPHVAELIEDLASYLDPVPVAANSLRGVNASRALARPRTCYDHLAGRLGVAVTEAMSRRGLLEQRTGFALTEAGLGWLTGPLGLDPATLVPGRRPLARACLDWTERRPHLAGVAGARLCGRVMERGWAVRIDSGRALQVTPSGLRALHHLLGLDAAALG